MSRTRKRISPNFVVEEFDTHDGTRVPTAALPALHSLCVHWLEPLRREFGPVAVTSGYRHLLYNRGVGSTDGSYHVYDRRVSAGGGIAGHGMVAADVVPARGSVADWVRWAEAWRRSHPTLDRRGLGGVGRYPRSGFVHLDTGPRRSWAG